MQAVILAGGLGTRLQPLTQVIPKPMAPVNGRPFLEYQLELLKKHGIVDIVLCTGYLGEKIEEHFGDGAALGMRIRYSKETIPLGTGGAIKNAKNFLAPEFLVLNGDTFLDIDYQKFIEEFRSANTLAAGVVFDNSGAGAQNNMSTNGGKITYYQKKESLHISGIDAGVQAFKKEVLDLMPSGAFGLEPTIFPKLIEQGQFAAFVTDKKFYDIGTFERLKAFEHISKLS